MQHILIVLICLFGSTQLQADSLSPEEKECIVGAILCSGATVAFLEGDLILGCILGIPGAILATCNTDNVLAEIKRLKRRYLEAKSLSIDIPFTERNITINWS